MDENLSYSSEIKKKIINLLMFSIYSDPRTIYREYVQNAFDSINKAVNEHILDQHKDGQVNITIDKSKKIIKVKDNGAGICLSEATRTLLDISASSKDGITAAGQFGIGRLVGGGYCHELIFRTSARGESQGVQITFDVDKIWKMVKEDEEDYLATYVINECTRREYIDTFDSDHFFEVEMKGVKVDIAPSLLDKNDVINYLNQVAPVEYKSQFVNGVIYKSTEMFPDYKKLHDEVSKVQVFVGSTRIQKQYGLSIEGTKDSINNLEYFTLKDDKYGELGWGWFALTKYTIQIPKDDNNIGIRLRKHNIQIGNASLLSGTKLWKEERGNSYFYGEFFITHKNIVPNGARDGLASTPEAEKLYEKFKVYFENLKNLYTKANEAKKSIDKLEEGFKKLKTGGLSDVTARDLIDNKGIGKFEKLVNSATFGPMKRMLDLYAPQFEEKKKSVEELRESLKQSEKPKGEVKKDDTPKKSTNDIQTVISEPNNDTYNPDNEVSSNPTPTDKQEDIKDKQTEETPTTQNNGDKSSIFAELFPTSSVLLGQQDIIGSLNGILSEDEIWILRKVFRVLNTYCPSNDHDQKLILNLEQLIVKEFSR